MCPSVHAKVPCKKWEWIFRDSFGLFYTLTGFSRHFMCIIQIWTTSTCSNALKLVENHMCVLGWISRSRARDGNEFQTPGHCWLPAKRWDAWFLNSTKSKTHLKFLKLGMLSWSGINMPWWKFCPIWDRFGYKLLTTSMMVSIGNVPPLGTRRYPLPLIAFKKFLVST